MNHLPKATDRLISIFSQIRGGIHKVFIFHDIYIDHHVVAGNQNNDNNISLLSPQTEDEENK
jgi:hypothetical protein